jgi:hypothetical protein
VTALDERRRLAAAVDPARIAKAEQASRIETSGLLERARSIAGAQLLLFVRGEHLEPA